MTIHDQYVARRPVLPPSYIDHFFQLQNLEEYIVELSHNTKFMEQILIASPDLYEELERIRFNSKAIQRDTVHKVIKYLLRMSARAMPFGLFSGISRKSFSKPSDRQNNSLKKARVSVEWLQLLCKRIEQEQSAHSELFIYKNHLVRETNEYIYFDQVVGTEKKRLEFKKSHYMCELFVYLRIPRTIQDIIQYFSKGNTSLQSTLLQSVKTLLDHHFLISEIRPSSIDGQQEGLEHLLQYHEIIPQDLYLDLLELKQSLVEYERLPLGEGIPLYLSIKEKMQRICVCNRYIVVDLFLEDKTLDLDKERISAMINDIHFLFSFHSISLNTKTWEAYTLKFLIEYGWYNEVPLLDVLDSDTGIGIPELLIETSEIEKKVDHFILNLIQDAFIQQEECIQFTDEDIQNLRMILQHKQQQKIHGGFDVKVNIVTEHGQEKMLLMGNSFARTAGSFTGRFYDSRACAMPKYHDADYLSAELNVVPNHYADIGITYYSSEYRINVNTGNFLDKSSIELDDLYLGMDQKGLYLKSKSFGKKIVPVTTHLLRYTNFVESPALLFLFEFGNYISMLPTDFTFGWKSKFKVVPRFEYKNIILAPKRWNIQKSEVKRSIKEEGLTEREYLMRFMKKYSLDEVVHIVNGDQTLPVYPYTELGLELIQAELKRLAESDTLTLLEAIEIKTNRNQAFLSDYIISVLPNTEPPDIVPKRKDVELLDQKGGYDFSWEYFNVYYRKGKRLETIRKCIEYLEQLGCQKYFVISYLDPDEHIRIRIKQGARGVKEEFRSYLIQLVQDSEIKKFTEDLFLPEYERYGGRTMSDAAYSLFCQETKWLYQLIATQFFKEKPLLEVGIQLCIYTVIDMFGSYREGLAFLDQKVGEQEREHLKHFKKQRSRFITLGEEAIELYQDSNPLLVQKRRDYRNYVISLGEKYEADRVYYALESMLHMTMNRFIGTDRRLEREIYEYACYTYVNLRYQLEIQGGYHEVI